jgi:ABC-type lipoprotein release transport system permease subunit
VPLHRYLAKNVIEKNMGNKSTPIFKLGLAGIVISIVIMQCTGFVIQGFKSEITNKIAVFNGYGQIESGISSSPYLLDSDSIKTILLDNKAKANAYLTAALTFQTKTGIKSVAVSGFETLPNEWNAADSNAVYVSHTMFQSMAINADSTASIIIASENEKYKIRKLKFIPIFNSYLEEIDEKTAFCYLPKLQDILQLGGKVDFEWKGDSITCISKNVSQLTVNGEIQSLNPFTLPSTEIVHIEIVDNNGVKTSTEIHPKTTTLNTHFGYVDAIRIENNVLSPTEIEYLLPYNLLYTTSQELYPQLFNWLKLLYTNVTVIIALVLAIALINNSSVLLVLIIEKTNLIAILKALGTQEKDIKKVFAYTGFKLNVKALIIGNIISLCIAFSQWQWHWLQLNPKDYFVEEVPFSFDISFFVGISLASLILPVLVSYLPLKILRKMNAAELLRLN